MNTRSMFASVLCLLSPRDAFRIVSTPGSHENDVTGQTQGRNRGCDLACRSGRYSNNHCTSCVSSQGWCIGKPGGYCHSSGKKCRDCAPECFRMHVYYKPINMRDQNRSVEASAKKCQSRCAGITGCAHFTFWGDGGCHLQDGDAVYWNFHSAYSKIEASGPPSCSQACSTYTHFSNPSRADKLHNGSSLCWATKAQADNWNNGKRGSAFEWCYRDPSMASSTDYCGQKNKNVKGPSTITLTANKNYCISLRGGVFVNNAPIHLYGCNGDYSQKWSFEGGNIKLSTNKNYCINLPGMNVADNSEINLYECNGHDSQKWTVEGGSIKLTANKSYCINLPGMNVANDVFINLYRCNEHASQKWSAALQAR